MPNINDESALVDEECQIDLDSGWERVQPAAEAPAATGNRESTEVDAYIISQVQDMRPRCEADYREPRRTLPHPCMQAVDSALTTNPIAWGLAGMSVLYVVWHFIPQLVAAWKRIGLPRGHPPCPRCWGHNVELDDGTTLTVEQCYKQLPAQQVRQLQKDKVIGTTRSHGWLRSPFRCAGLGQPELLMAYQYKCVDCPVAGNTGRKSTNTSFFMASDKGLLDIMKQEGMGCYVDIMQLQRGAKVGLNSSVAKLITSAVVKSATIKLFADCLKEIGMMHYLKQKLAYFSWVPHMAKGHSTGRQQTIEGSIAKQQRRGQQQQAQQQQGDAAPISQQPAAEVLPAAAAAAGPSADCMSQVQPFPQPAALPGAAVSQTYVTAQLLELSEKERQYKRSVIEHASSSATILSADFQHYPTKMVHTSSGRVATAIFNLMDVKTGAIVTHLWTQSVSVAEVEHVLRDLGKRREAGGCPKIQLIYVDDPKLFQLLADVFPGAELVQDGFHVLDRFSRAIPADNTLKSSFMGELAAAIYVEHKPDRVLVEAALQVQDKTLANVTTAWRNQRIRRTILGGAETQAAVLEVLEKYKDKVCTATGASVVTDELMLVYSNQAKADIAVKDKLCSTFDLMRDVLPLDEIYVQRNGEDGVDGHGLKVYWCLRGSSSEESMHGQLNKLLKGGHYSPEVAQMLLEQWFYRRAVDALRKGGTYVPDTYDLQLIEAVKDAQAAAGVEVDYAGWSSVPLLEQPLPAFGLDFEPKPLQTASVWQFKDLSEEDEMNLRWHLEEQEEQERREKLAKNNSLRWDVVDDTLVAGPGSTAYCKSCCGRSLLKVVNKVQAVCSKGHIVLDLEADDDNTPAPSSHKGLTDGLQAGSSAGAAGGAAADDDSDGTDADQAADVRRSKRPRKQLSTAEKVRRLHGKMPKTAGANASISRFFTPVDTPYEQLLFWDLYQKHTSSGRTQWETMAAVWCYKAQQQHQLGNFTVSFKTAKDLKDWHKKIMKDMALQLSRAPQQLAGDTAAAQAAAQEAKAAAAAAEAAAAAVAFAAGQTPAQLQPLLPLQVAPYQVQAAANDGATVSGQQPSKGLGAGMRAFGSSLLGVAAGTLGFQSSQAQHTATSTVAASTTTHTQHAPAQQSGKTSTSWLSELANKKKSAAAATARAPSGSATPPPPDATTGAATTGIADATAVRSAVAQSTSGVLPVEKWPPGYPRMVENGGKHRKITTCSSCGTPTRMPDPANLGQLLPTPHNLHCEGCPRRTGERVFTSGAKRGQTAKSAAKRTLG